MGACCCGKDMLVCKKVQGHGVQESLKDSRKQQTGSGSWNACHLCEVKVKHIPKEWHEKGEGGVTLRLTRMRWR